MKIKKPTERYQKAVMVIVSTPFCADMQVTKSKKIESRKKLKTNDDQMRHGANSAGICEFV